MEALGAETMFEDEAMPSYLQDAALPEMSNTPPVYVDEPSTGQVSLFIKFFIDVHFAQGLDEFGLPVAESSKTKLAA